MEERLLEWIKVVGPLVISWPTFGLTATLVFRKPLLALIEKFTESPESKAEIGPLKLELGHPILPPQYSAAIKEEGFLRIDMSEDIGEIRQQGQEGSVVGFAVAYAMQAAIKAKKGEKVVLSPRSIYNAAKKYDGMPIEEDTGANLSSALSAMEKIGAYLETDWPYSYRTEPKPGTNPAYKISIFSEVRGIDGIVNAMKQGKIVIISVYGTEDFTSDDSRKNGKIVIRLPLRTIGGHAICLVGYDQKLAEFKFANSWGNDWGVKGFGTIRDSDLAQILINAYTLEL
jgi:C1A family cysteine protease